MRLVFRTTYTISGDLYFRGNLLLATFHCDAFLSWQHLPGSPHLPGRLFDPLNGKTCVLKKIHKGKESPYVQRKIKDIKGASPLRRTLDAFALFEKYHLFYLRVLVIYLQLIQIDTRWQILSIK